MATVTKLHQRQGEVQVETLAEFVEQHPSAKILSVIVFETNDGMRQLGLHLPQGLDYLTLLGAVETLRDKILQEMRNA